MWWPPPLETYRVEHPEDGGRPRLLLLKRVILVPGLEPSAPTGRSSLVSPGWEVRTDKAEDSLRSPSLGEAGHTASSLGRRHIRSLSAAADAAA